MTEALTKGPIEERIFRLVSLVHAELVTIMLQGAGEEAKIDGVSLSDAIYNFDTLVNVFQVAFLRRVPTCHKALEELGTRMSKPEDVSRN